MYTPPRLAFVVAAFALLAATASGQSTAPATPVITSYDTTSPTPSFHGTAEPGVTIRRDWSPSSLLRTTARADGTWDLAWSGAPLDAGRYTFFFDAINSAGVSSTNSASAEVNVPVSGPPVMNPIPDQETTWQYREKDYPVSFSVHATNLPLHYDATGLPPGTSLSGTNPALITYTLDGITGGIFKVSVTATNSYGTSAPATFTWTIHPGMTDFIASDKFFYPAGDRITLKAHFSTPVVVTGTPYIPLWGTKKALYAGGSGTATLTFTYQLASDDPAASGLYFDTINAGDGSITTTDQVSASLQDSYYGLGSPPKFSIGAPGAPVAADATVTGTVGVPIQPVQLQATNSPTSFANGPGATLSTYGLSLSSSGLITGTPTKATADTVYYTAANSAGPSAPAAIHLSISTSDPAAPVITSYDATSSTPSFRGTTPPGTKVMLNGTGSYFVAVAATVDANGNWTATWTTTPLLTGTYTFVAVAMDSAGKQTQSTPVLVKVPFGPPVVRPQVNRETTYAWSRFANPVSFAVEALNSPEHFSATGTPPGVTFAEFTTAYGEVVGGFTYDPSALSGGAYTVSVTASNSAGTSAPVTFQWLVHPGMVDFLAPDASQYHAGDVITLTAKFSAPVVVTGTPYVALWGTKKAMYAGGSGTSTLTFTYQVANDDPAASGLYYRDITPGGGTLATSDGVSASLHDTYEGNGVFPTFSIVTSTSTPPPPATNPPPSSKTAQTITFSSPVSAITVGQPIQLGATSSAGLPITYTVLSGDATISGNVLTPTSTADLVVRAASAGNDTVAAAVADVDFGSPQKGAQTIAVATTGGAVPAEKPVSLSATASSGLPVTYSVVSGPATIDGNTLTFTGTGTVVVRASQSGNGSYAAASDSTLTFTANPVDRLVNLSSRLHVGPDAGHVAIAGFVVTGTAPKPILIRAVGPTLSAFGIKDGVAAPQLWLKDNTGKVIASNSGWHNDTQIAATGDALGAFRLNRDSGDAAILITLAPGLYTAQVMSSGMGAVLIEVYDGTANAPVPTKQLINISTRGTIDAGDAMIGGFVVNGAQPKRVLIRAVGPGLSTFGVSGVLADPALKIFDSTGAVIAQNDNWESGQAGAGLQTPASAAEITAADTAAGAFALQPGAADAAVVLTLAPGAYTAVVTGANGATGAALVEVYELPAP